MASELMSTVDDDAPALAGAIVHHAVKVCESVDHLWRVLGNVVIPEEGLTDDRQQHKVTNGTESMARVYLYQQIYDLGQGEVADRLTERTAVQKKLDLNEPPTQQTISYAWKQFSDQTKKTLDAAATGIALQACEHDVTIEACLPILPDEDETADDDDVQEATREQIREKGTKIVELARKHGFG